MKQGILEVIAYLFKNYWYSEDKLPEDYTEVMGLLQKVGFDPEIVLKTFDWLEMLMRENSTFQSFPSANSIRIFTAEEQIKLSEESRSFILFLEQEAVLDAKAREILLDQLMRLNTPRIEIADVKWVALLVLFNEEDARDKLLKLEEMIIK